MKTNDKNNMKTNDKNNMKTNDKNNMKTNDKNNMKIDIAIGHSVNTRAWKNQKWSWSKISEKLLKAHKTNEKHIDFLKASKEDKLKIKDVGGYVGGYLRNGRRKPENVAHRQLITLDIDEAHINLWNDFQIQFDNAAVLHGTHNHSAESPRYRLVMPISREVTPDEYVAIARYVAGTLGIDLFDSTTFQCERLMFWPSTSIDCDYFAISQNGNWIDADSVLESYVDWTDSSAWAVSKNATSVVKSAVSKQEDPGTKQGIVGAFCRTFLISEGIAAFLSEEYIRSENERYTYTKGSAAAGLVVYGDKFAFSHHGTDPCSGKLCNTFDLVRLHKFGHLDKGLKESTTKSKSFIAMQDFCVNNAEVKKTIASEKIGSSDYDFANPLAVSLEEKNIAWAAALEIDGKGKYTSSATNISLILANDITLKGFFKENLFDNKKYVMRTLPWRSLKRPEPIRNVDYSGIRNYLEAVYGIIGNLKVEDALNLEFEKHAFNPIKDYLAPLVWDGKERIARLLVDYFGADDNAYTQEAMTTMLVGAVARIFKPGIKFDLVLTLVGHKQGTGKSTFFAKLGKEWFSDSFHTISGKEAFEQLQGSWIIEMAEMAGVRKSEIEPIKHFITKQEDTYRPAYGRIVETFKRKCVFVATTNEKDFMRDPSGGRRFMPIDVHEYRIKKNILDKKELTGTEVDQIWAEALSLYKEGRRPYLSKEAEKIARKEQLEHSQVDDRRGLVDQFLNLHLPKDWEREDLYARKLFLKDPLSPKGVYQRQIVCVAEVWCECLDKEKNTMNRYNTKEINDILRSLDEWEQHNSTKNFALYGKQKYFSRKLY